MRTVKKNFEFKRALSRGKCLSGKYLSIYFFPTKLNIIRYGFAIGKKAGNAVERNRIRRIIREVVRLQNIDFDKKGDMIFVWKNRLVADQVDFWKIKKEIEFLMEKGRE